MNKSLREIKPNESFCINCAFFEKFDQQKKDDNILGSCKANPPTVPFPLLDAKSEDELKKNRNKLGVWPLVLGNFWCGVFETLRRECQKIMKAKKNEIKTFDENN
jgi:hypothetical protein